MIFHLSIDADDPRQVAQALAEIWGCEAYPFPPVAEGSWIVLADDGRNSAVEVYPRGVTLRPGADGQDAQACRDGGQAFTATHFAAATPWSEARIHELATARGWRSSTQSRGGLFHVIEVWIENRILVEVLTDQMQAEYLAAVTPANWRAAVARRAA